MDSRKTPRRIIRRPLRYYLHEFDLGTAPAGSARSAAAAKRNKKVSHYH